MTTLHYLITKSAGVRKARKSVSLLLSLFEIAPVNKTVLGHAQNLPFKDFEHAVLHETARAVNANAIVTRNAADFKRSGIPIRLPGNLKQANCDAGKPGT